MLLPPFTCGCGALRASRRACSAWLQGRILIFFVIIVGVWFSKGTVGINREQGIRGRVGCRGGLWSSLVIIFGDWFSKRTVGIFRGQGTGDGLAPKPLGQKLIFRFGQNLVLFAEGACGWYADAHPRPPLFVVMDVLKNSFLAIILKSVYLYLLGFDNEGLH